MKSNAIKEGIAKAPHRALLYAGGLSDKNIKRPFIGIASSFFRPGARAYGNERFRKTN